MIYVRIKHKWYITEFKTMYDITFEAYEYLDYMYNDDTRYMCGQMVPGSDVAPDWLRMELWLQQPVPKFDEKKFNKHISHYETTGAKVGCLA